MAKFTLILEHENEKYVGEADDLPNVVSALVCTVIENGPDEACVIMSNNVIKMAKVGTYVCAQLI